MSNTSLSSKQSLAEKLRELYEEIDRLVVKIQSSPFDFPQVSMLESNSGANSLAISHGELLRLKPGSPTILSQALERTAIHSSNKGIVYIESNGKESLQLYPALLEEAQRILGGLRRIGLKPQDKVIFQLTNNQDFIAAFWGCMLGGFVPVPIALAQPAAGIAPTYSESNGAVSKLHRAWQMLEHPIILTSQKLTASILSLSALWAIEDLGVATIEELRANAPDKNLHHSHPEDLALLMLTSGSTGMPKGVMLSHRNLLSVSASTAQMNNRLVRKFATPSESGFG